MTKAFLTIISFPVTSKLPIDERSATPSVVELVSARVISPNSKSSGSVIFIVESLTIGYLGPMKNLNLYVHISSVWLAVYLSEQAVVSIFVISLAVKTIESELPLSIIALRSPKVEIINGWVGFDEAAFERPSVI